MNLTIQISRQVFRSYVAYHYPALVANRMMLFWSPKLALDDLRTRLALYSSKAFNADFTIQTSRNNVVGNHSPGMR